MISGESKRRLAGDSISVGSPNLMNRLVRTLERSQFDREFHTWSRMLLHLAWISLATHVLVFINRMIAPPHPLTTLVAIRLFEILGMGAVLWWFRGHWFPPRGAPARQLLSLWSGYVIGSLMLILLECLAAWRAHVGSEIAPRVDDFAAYPAMAVLASLLFIMLGSSYWGYCYAMGAAFLALAVMMTLWAPAAPLLFGAAWAASLSILGIRLGRLVEIR